jgi:predicted RNA methylase
MGSSEKAPSLAAAALRWQRDSLRARGVVGSLRYLAGQCIEYLRDSMPERRRSRFGDIDYDCEHAVDTTWARLSTPVRLREIFTERLYQPTSAGEFAEMMELLRWVDLSRYTFVDLGSGKGRVLLMASLYPFHRVVGVEVQPALDAVARQNVSRFVSDEQRCRRIETLCADAREFNFPATDLVVYLFNPFPDYVLREVLGNLVRSVQRHPRSIYVLYNAPYDQKEFRRFPELECSHSNSRYQLYFLQGPEAD